MAESAADSAADNEAQHAGKRPRSLRFVVRFVVLVMVLLGLLAVAIVVGFGPRVALRRDDLIATGLAVAVIGVGASLLLRFVKPRLHRLERHATGLRGAQDGPTRQVGEQEALEELSASEARFKRLTDSAPVMVFLTDAQGQSIYVNPMWHEITGLPADAAFGSGWLRAVHPEDRPRLERCWAETFNAGRDVASLPDARFQTPEGKISWLGGTVVALRDAAGELTGYLGMLTDLTERRRVDEELRKIETRAHEAEKLASISVLTSRIAHDIGAPLTAILGYAELMQKSITGEKNRKRATIIVEQVNRISELIQTLLDMTRSGERPHIAVDLAPLLDKSLDFFRESLRKHAIEVERIYEVSPRIPADPDRFQQALLSLVMHAIDAMPGGGTLRISLTSPDPTHVEIRVADTGDGIAPEMLSGIFDPLMTTRPLGSARGLGLVVARSIVEEHAGTLSVSSTVGKGTEFTIRFGIDPG